MNRFVAYLLCVSVAAVAVAQVNVTGKVIDKENNEPLVGASVIVKGADLWAQSNTLFTVDQNIEDFNFAVKELETSYAGVDTYVNDVTRQEYDSIISTLRHGIEIKGRPGYDAALFLYSWFDDGHLGMDMGSFRETGKYMSDRRKYQQYDMINPY